jgi:hypothetical protein
VFTKGAKKMFQGTSADWTDHKAAWVAACVMAGLVFLTIVVVLPLLYWKANKKFDNVSFGVTERAPHERRCQQKTDVHEISDVISCASPFSCSGRERR